MRSGTARASALLTVALGVATGIGPASAQMPDRSILTDAEHHLGVRVRFRRDGTMPSRGEYWIEDWGVLDARKVLARANSR